MQKVKSGWLSVYKPCNISSSKAIIKIKNKFKLNKIGHAGTLDPLAEGVLPVAFGNTTKIISFTTKNKKTYNFKIRWGQQTDTDDLEGNILYTSKKIPNQDIINNCLKNFIGEQNQVPPKYSAVKINGKRAYKLSRDNINFDLLPRKRVVYSLKYIKNTLFNESQFLIVCGSGYYIRSLARDMGIFLGTRGHISSIERLKVGIFDYKNTILLDDLLKIGHLSSGIKGFYHSSVVLDDIPALTVNNEAICDIRMGKKINVSYLSDNTLKEFHFKKFVRVNNNNELIALGNIQNNFFIPKKVFNKEI